MRDAILAAGLVLFGLSAILDGYRRLKKGPRKVPLTVHTEELELLERWPRIYFGVVLAVGVFCVVAALVMLR